MNPLDKQDLFQQQHGYYIEDMSIGMSAMIQKTFTEADVLLFSAVSGDTNPIHMSDEFAKQTRFKQRIIHGMLTTSLWSTLAGTKLPGAGCAYLMQTSKFLSPVLIGETVTATISVKEIMLDRQQVKLTTEAFVGERLVATGEAKMWVPLRSKQQ
ncbi:MAG: 3-hydroxybutyryl-CoA dehydratase [Arenicella sp.]|jgi:3-hydroxybutyryl-CoA dehydratase